MQHQFRVGDLVMVYVPNLARYTWPLARIIELYPDVRGTIRSAKIKCNRQEYLRPIEHLVPLEMDAERSEDGSADEEAGEAQYPDHSLPSTGEEEVEALDKSTDVFSEHNDGGAGPLSERERELVRTHNTQSAACTSRGRPRRQAAAQSRATLRELIRRRQV